MTFVWGTMIFQLIGLVLLFLFVYCMILFIAFARRAIRALDIYLEKNQHEDSYDRSIQ